MASNFLFLLLLIYLANTIIAATDGEFPPYLTFEQYRGVQTFAGDEDSKLLISELSNNGWDNVVLDTWYTNLGVEQQYYRSLKIEGFNSNKNVKNLFPYIVCDTNESDRHGVDRYELIDSVLSKMCEESESDNDKKSKYFIKRVPIYNNNVNSKNKDKSNEHTLHGACFFSSIEVGLAKSIKEEGILVTPVAPFLKMRKNIISGPSEDYNEEESTSRFDEDTISLAVTLAPGVFSSHDEVMEFASNIKQIQDMDQNDSFSAECDKKPYQRSSITVGSSQPFYFFFYEIEKQDLVAGITHRCHRLFLEHVVTKPQVISVEKVAKNTISNFHAKWIVESSEKEKNPFKDIGLSGNGEVIFVADTGLDQQHCYLKDYSGETVPLTTDFDLTGKINHDLRKVVQYIALDDIDSDSQDLNGHGSHVVGTIVGKRLDENGQETQGVGEGIASSAKVCFYDGTGDDSKSVSVNSLISQFFYFGKIAGARINSSSWNSGFFGEYDEKSRQVDEYFYNDPDDKMLMINSSGNDGESDTGTATVGTVKYPCVSKNALCIGASHNYKSDIDIDEIDVVAFFSSYGPTADGRIKPDLIAPGHQILSLEANSNKCGASQYDSAGNNDGLTFKSGTSMACPVVAGAAALVREYFATGYYPTGEKENEKMDITGSLLKAILINGAVELKRISEDDSGYRYIESTFYDRYQGFGKVNLLNSLKLANEISSPDLYVENERIIEKGQTHEYVFNDVCKNNEFRVTLVWRDPPSDSGCAECLVNDLDLEVLYDGKNYYPNGRDGADETNNVERVIIKTNDLTNPTGNMVHVKVKTANFGYGNSQKYSLASTGCFDSDEVELIGSDSGSKCEDDEFEYTIDIFTNRKPEETSWILTKQGSDEVIAAVIAGEYEEDVGRLRTFRQQGCITEGCYVFIIKDTAFDGLCCAKGMGSYSIRAGDLPAIKGDSFIDRQKIEKFCNYGTDAIEPTTSPTALVCDEDEFKYQIDIETDLYPDETRWRLLRKLNGVDEGSYIESYTEYVYEGCLDLSMCYSLSQYGYGEYTIKANEFIVFDRERFEYGREWEDFCYDGQSINSTPSYGIRTETVGSNYGEKFDDMHPLWEYGKIVQIELYSKYSEKIYFIGITYETGQSFEHGWMYGTRHTIALDEDQYITKVSGRADNYIRQLKFETNDGEVFGPVGSSTRGDPFELDFGENALVYIFGKAYSLHLYQLGFAHASLPQTITDSPTAQPTTLPCGDNQVRYGIIVRTDGNPEIIWWDLNQVVDSIPYMTYRKQLETYSHTGCLTIDGNYEFQMIDNECDGLCCYFGSGSYKLSVDGNVVVRGNNFDDAIHFGDYWNKNPDFFVYKKHEFSYSSTSQPTSNPIELACSDDEFEYRIRIRTNAFPDWTSWNFQNSNGDVIESVGGYVVQHYEYNHRGCLPLDKCFEFYIEDYYGLCCEYGNGGYTVFANDVIMAEGGEGDEYGWHETKSFCYGPSYSQSLSPSSYPTTLNPSSHLVCEENEFKYKVIVTTDRFPIETSWELSYDDGTIIDNVEKWDYSEKRTEHVHEGCIDLDSCVIFTIFQTYGWGFYGRYTLLANDIVMAEGREFIFNETKTFCYGPSHSFSPSTLSNQICENGSYNNYWCAYWASIGACENSGSRDWMLENCEKACSNCCMDYEEWWCDLYYHDGRCTDTSQFLYLYSITWQEWMQGECRKSCDTCDLDFTPSPPPPVTCSDDQFKYEIILTNDDGDHDYFYFYWSLYYKYPDTIDERKIDFDRGYFPPNYEERYYGCVSYSCFELQVNRSFLKMYNKDKDILIGQNTERYEELRFCHYAPEPTTSPIIPPPEAFITISLEFSTSQSNYEDISIVVQRSVMKILFHAQIDDENIVTDILDGFFGEESNKCEIIIQVCTDICGEEEEPDFLAFVGNTMKEGEANGQLLQTIKATADDMDVGIVDSLTKVSIFHDFEYDAWPTTPPTTLPSSTPTQDCNSTAVVQNLFGFITNIFQPVTQAIINTTDPISDVLFGVESYNSSNNTCADKMFELQIEIKTDGTPEKTSWELLYENGTIIESIGRDTYSECDTVYNHSYCLDTSCFVFNMFDSFEFKGSYNITDGESVLAQQDSFMWWKDSKRFCYPQCEDDNMFALQIELKTDNWPQETSWDLTFDNGTIIDNVEERYYTQRNTVYSHRYCLLRGCYDITFHDHIGDGMCCSYGEGSYNMKINDDNVIREGGEFQESVRKSFCHMTAETSDEENSSSLFGIITDLFGDESCCTTDATGYPTPVPSPYFSSQPSILPSSNPSTQPSIFISSNPSTQPSISISSNPSLQPSDENEFKYEIIVTTDDWPGDTSWELKYDDGTIIDSVEQGEYTEQYHEHVHEGCLDLDSCVIFTIFDSWGDGICCSYGNGGYTIMANDVVMAEGGDGSWNKQTHEFCFGPSYSLQPSSNLSVLPSSNPSSKASSNPSSKPSISSKPSSNPTILVCDENEFKYEFIVTTDDYPGETSWELKYDDGTIIDNVDRYEYAMKETEHVHNGCLDLDSCVIFIIYDSYGDGICCRWGDGGYTIFANDVVVAEGGDGSWNKQTHEFCYP